MHRRGFRDHRGALHGFSNRTGLFYIAEQGHHPRRQRRHAYDEDGGENADDHDARARITAAAKAGFLLRILFLRGLIFNDHGEGLRLFFLLFRGKFAQALGDARRGQPLRLLQLFQLLFAGLCIRSIKGQPCLFEALCGLIGGEIGVIGNIAQLLRRWFGRFNQHA